MRKRCFTTSPQRKQGPIVACTGILFFLIVLPLPGLAIPARPLFDPPAPPPAPKVNKNLARVTNPGEVYDLINRNKGTQTLNWPSPEIQRVAGSDTWGAWRPKRGDVGEIIAICQHPFQPLRVFILKIGPYYAPMGETGIELVSP